MFRNFFKIAISFIVILLLVGCATTKAPFSAFTPFTPHQFQLNNYTKKIDNFIILQDTSSSMGEKYAGRKKLDLAKDILNRMNQTIPELGYICGLRSYGRGFNFSGKYTSLVYGMKRYSKAELGDAIKPLRCAGLTPLGYGINGAVDDLKGTQGKIAVIILSDGVETGNNALASVKHMRNIYMDRICIYTVLIGDNATGKRLMEQIASVGSCGFAVNADQIYSSEGMAGFVEKVFLTETAAPLDTDGDGVYDYLDKCPGTPKGVEVDSKGCPLDTDGDGVYDYLDKCPGTPRGVEVDSNGCPLDTDGDGVYDYLDKCPGTPRGVEVDSKGCPLDTDGDGVYDYLDKCPGTPRGAKVDNRGCWVLKGVYFDTGKWSIRPQSYPVLDEVVRVLKRNQGLRIEIQGYTDNVGRASYNQSLSEKRAKSVMEYFIGKGIGKDMLIYKGYGMTHPMATNTTEEGRALNRRVELKPVP